MNISVEGFTLKPGNKFSTTIGLTAIGWIIILSFNSCNRDKSRHATGTEKISPIVRFKDADTFDESWSKTNTLVSHLIGEPDNLHPTNGTSAPHFEIFTYTQQYLVTNDLDNQVLSPSLVKSLPQISDDGLRYTYEFRNGPKWDDGKAISFDDMNFTAKASKCLLTNNPSSRSYWQNLKTIESDPSNPLMFTLVMKKKHILNVAFLTSFPLMEQSFHDPQNILNHYSFEQLDDTSLHVEKHEDLIRWSTEFNDDKYGRDPAFLNGLGPYRVENWESGISVTLVKKQRHYASSNSNSREAAFPDKIIFKINKDDNSTMLELKSQAIDVSLNLSMNNYLTLSENPEFTKNYNATLTLNYNYTYIAFNEKPEGTSRKPLFTSLAVRKAFALLTPVDKITKLIYHQYSDQCIRMVTNVSPLKPEFNSELLPIQFNLEEGSKLLSKDGWKDSDGDGVLDKVINDQKISMEAELYYLNSSPDWKDMASLLAEEYAKAGIHLVPVSLDFKRFLEKARSHDFDLLLGGLGASSLPEDYSQLWQTASWSNHGSNYSGFGSPQSDALIDSIKTELDVEKRTALSHRLQKLIYDDQPFVFLYTTLRRNVIHKRFGNQVFYPERPGIFLNTLRLLSTTN